MASPPFFFMKASEIPSAKIYVQNPLNKSMKNNINPNMLLPSFPPKFAKRPTGAPPGLLSGLSTNFSTVAGKSFPTDHDPENAALSAGTICAATDRENQRSKTRSFDERFLDEEAYW